MYTFAQPLGQALSTAAGSPAVVCQDSRRTYAELDADYPGTAAVSQVLTMPDDYEDLIASAAEIPFGDGVAEDDLATLFYTSGTTGAAKGAMHTHRSLVSSAMHFMATWPFDRQILKRDLREPHWAGQHTQISGG